jgi:predicted nucleic acid-binding protein
MVPRRLLLDTSVLYAFYYEGDDFHQNALEMLRQADQETLVIHPYVIQEAVWLLSNRLNLGVTIKFLDDLGRNNVVIPLVDTLADIAFYKELNRRTSLTDATLVRYARLTGDILLTFDRELRTLAARA